MVRYAQFCDLPCDPTPQQSIQFEEDYKNVKGMLSIKSLNTKIQPLFQEFGQETAKIYSLAVNGTHADFLLSKNRHKFKMQTQSISELASLSEFLTYKTQELKQLETALKANLEEEFKNLVLNIQGTLNKIYNQYRHILKEQFQTLKDETEKQTKIIKIQLKRLEKELDRQSLRRKKLTEDQIAKIAGISKQEMFGYSTLFRIVSNETLEEIQAEERAENEREISIDNSKIKKINCNQLWYLMELIKKKKDQMNNPDLKMSTIFETDRNRWDTRNMKPSTIIERPDILNGFEEQTFKTETNIIEEISSVLIKKSKDLKKESLNSSMNESVHSEIVSKLLTDFLKDKHMKSLAKSIESKIQSEFVDFNQKFNYNHFIQNKATRIQKRRQMDHVREEQAPQEENTGQAQKFSVDKKYISVYQPIQQDGQSKGNKQAQQKSQPQRDPQPKIDPKRNPSPKNEPQMKQSKPHTILDGQRYNNHNPYDRQGWQNANVNASFGKPGSMNNTNERDLSKDKTIIDKLSQFKPNQMDSIQKRPLIAQKESFNENSFSRLHYEDESISIVLGKKEAQEQFSEYAQKMKRQQQIELNIQRKNIQEELSMKEIKRIQQEEEKQKMQTHQRKLNQEDEFRRMRQNKSKQNEKEKEKEKRKQEIQKERERERIREKEKEHQLQLRKREISKENRERQKSRERYREKQREKQQQRYREKQREKQQQRYREKQREKQQQRQREKASERERERERERQREKSKDRQRNRQRQSQRQRQLQRQKEAKWFKDKEFQKLRRQKQSQKSNDKYFVRQEQQKTIPQFFKKDLESSKVVEEWRQQKSRKLREDKLRDDSKYGQPKYDARGNLINEKQRRQSDSFTQLQMIPGVDMQEQYRIMQQIQSKKHQLPKPQENPLKRRFDEQVNPHFGGRFENEREFEKPYQGNFKQEFGLGDYFKEKQQNGFEYDDIRKQQLANESLLKFALEESLHDVHTNPNGNGIGNFMKKKKTPFDYIKPVGKFIANAFTNVVVPNFAPVINRKLEETIDNTLIDFEEFLSGMGKKKESFSLQENFKYNLDEIEAYEMFEGDEEEKTQTKLIPRSMGGSKGQMTIRQLQQKAQQLNNTKDEFSIFVKVLQPVFLTFKPRDQFGNRPMTKFIVGDSTGIAVLYMSYFFEIKAGCCLRLDNCRLHKYCQSFQINHVRNITIHENVRQASFIPRVQNNLALSLIRNPVEGKYLYEVKPFFNFTLSHCVQEFTKNGMTIGQILLRKPIIVTVCDVTRTTRKCILGDYTGKIAADLSNLKKSISIDDNDTLLIRKAKIQINKGAILLLTDGASIIVKADRRFKFSHDNRYIPDKMLKGNVA